VAPAKGRRPPVFEGSGALVGDGAKGKNWVPTTGREMAMADEVQNPAMQQAIAIGMAATTRVARGQPLSRSRD